ncbi:MAG: iron-containing alcohol dehydrogenase, partial [Actinobacteria bacterium]|nr:iron-containing alcohol dehydrogenase [Actinomycetota bacterium]
NPTPDKLMKYGYSAKLAVESGVASAAVEKIVEANTLLSGIGFESSGLAAAHATHDGLTVLEETHHYYHGEKVAFGTLTQIVMENRSTGQLNEVLEFCVKVGLPVTLAEVGVVNPTPDKLMKYGYSAKLAVESGVASAAVEKIVEANTLLSGIGRRIDH